MSLLNRGVALLALAAGAGSLCRAENPFVTSIYTADPSAHVWADGRLYVYPSRDVDPPKGCDLMDRYHVFSTDDMVHWRDEGQVLQASQVKWGRPEGGFMWAPDCAFKNGTYYFYFPHPSGKDWNHTWKVGVATSKSPAKDFVPADEPIKGLEGFAMIDPAAFVDTDGQPYIYFGGGGKCQGGKLKDNMVELDGPMQKMEGLEDFHEATWVFKRNGTYYLTYADNHKGQNQMRYATGSSPLGPWQYRGVYLEGTGSDTNHGSVVEYKGQWYAFYHNQAISGKGNLRSICVDKLEFNNDGTIRLVKQTREGVPPVATEVKSDFAAITYAARNAVLSSPAKLGDDGSIQNLHLPNAACEFAEVDGGAGGRALIDIAYATPEKAKLKLIVNGEDCSFLNAPPTGDWATYAGHATFTLPLKPGKTNTVKLLGGTGGVNIQGITVTPLDIGG